MTTAIRKIANAQGLYDYVEAINPVDYPTLDWAIDPDISAVGAVPRVYWKWNGSVVVEMTQVEKDAIDDYDAPDELNPVEALTIVNEQSYMADETKVIDLTSYSGLSVVSVYDPSVSELAGGGLLSAAGSGPVGWDPNNVGTGEASINNGNYTDLVYNNSAAGNTSGVIMGIDMLTPTAINYMKRWDYSASYYDTSWEFIGTDDATAATYTVIFAQTQTAPFLDPTPFERSFPEVTFRYYGWRCVTSFNATYTISRELELYNGTIELVKKPLDFGVEYDFYIDDGMMLHITNKDTPRTLRVVLMGND